MSNDEKFGSYRTLEGQAPQQPIIGGTTPEEMRMALNTQHVCGSCRSFSLAEGQRLMEAQRFVERLVREQEWQARHLASPLNALGICGNGLSGAPGEHAMITGRITKACDAFRPNNGLVSISRRSTDAR